MRRGDQIYLTTKMDVTLICELTMTKAEKLTHSAQIHRTHRQRVGGEKTEVEQRIQTVLNELFFYDQL